MPAQTHDGPSVAPPPTGPAEAGGLSAAEAAHRLAVEGANELVSRRRSTLPGEILSQLTHPLALLLWVAAALAWPTSGPTLAAVIVGVILLNAAFAVLQERQAVRAVAALRAYMPARSTVIRDGRRQVVAARTLVPGDLPAHGRRRG
jgi:magnesium-transporting ATPase (P-type)